MNPVRAVIAGGGPAGLAAAIHAAKTGARAVLLERNAQCGVKLLATGGGHCNVANLRPAKEWPALFGRRGRFIVPALDFLPREALCAWLAELGVPTRSPDGFHIFPVANSAKAVRDALLGEARRLGVDIRTGCRVEKLLAADGEIRGVVVGGEEIAAERVIVACGGRSYPATGSTGDGFLLAEGVGHKIRPAFPGLVGLRVSNLDPDLAGLVLPDAEVHFKVRGREAIAGRGELLLTHSGVSGPAVLDLSASVAEALERVAAGDGVILRVRWLADMDAEAWLEKLAAWRGAGGSASIPTRLRDYLPARLARWLCAFAGVEENAGAATLRAEVRDKLAGVLGEFPATVTASEGWGKAMITRGGVELGEVDPGTLESRVVAGLHFAGETLNVDGPCGGYNLHWAFASGALAGVKAAAGES